MRGNLYSRPGYGPFTSPGQPGVTNVDAAGLVTYETPQNFEYPKDQFFDFIQAQIISASTKKIADPTLMVLEGESSSVGVGTTYATNCETITTDTSTSTNISSSCSVVDSSIHGGKPSN